MVGSDAHPRHQPVLFKRKGKGTERVGKRDAFSSPKVPIPNSEKSAPLPGLSPQGFERLLPATLGARQLLTPPRRETAFASPTFSQARMAGPISSQLSKNGQFSGGPEEKDTRKL